MNAAEPLVSVIAIFFDLEDCVQKCVNSILAQSYGNIEIILVNDGSSDGTAAVLNEYILHEHVRVIHTENYGPGAARNAGMNAASGEWIMYVDGDDYLCPWSVELLMACALAAEVPLAIGAYNVIIDDIDDRQTVDMRAVDARVLDNRAGIEAFLLEEVTESPWAKVIRADTAKAHPFPEGCWYEDVMWAPGLYLDCDAVAIVNLPVYAYVMRSGSVVHRKCAQLKQAQDFLQAIDVMTGSIDREYPDLSALVAYRRALGLSRLHALLKTMKGDVEATEMDERCLQEIKVLVPRFKDEADVPMAKRKRVELIAIAPALHDFALRGYERFVKGRGGARS